ncbi:hypothetical protein LP419_35090 [Massilia sp. H-1]|nr:hypothetical protein LP419_35090 [Massilia sp. H-1]
MAELQSTRDDLRRAERLAALGAMVAKLSRMNSIPRSATACWPPARWNSGCRVSPPRPRPACGAPTWTTFVSDVVLASSLLQRNLAASARLVNNFKQVATGQDGSIRRRFALADLLGQVLGAQGARLREAGVQATVAQAPGVILDSYPLVLEQILLQWLDNALVHGVGSMAPCGSRPPSNKAG